jgi:5'-phosphate synthase pdxT subunit
VIPGGESTTITRLAALYGLDEAIRAFGRPVFGTCAGMILLDRRHLGLADLEVERNAYGRQVSSFEADLELPGEPEPFRGVFIRAPRVRDLGAAV